MRISAFIDLDKEHYKGVCIYIMALSEPKQILLEILILIAAIIGLIILKKGG